MIKTFAQLANGEPTKEVPKQPTAEEIAEMVVNKMRENPEPKSEEDPPEEKEEEE